MMADFTQIAGRHTRLCIPGSLAAAIPPPEHKQWRRRAAEFQYMVLMAVQQLQGTMPMPASSGAVQETQLGKRQQVDSLWGTALRRMIIKPQVSDHKLWTHCRCKAPAMEHQGAKLRQARGQKNSWPKCGGQSG